MRSEAISVAVLCAACGGGVRSDSVNVAATAPKQVHITIRVGGEGSGRVVSAGVFDCGTTCVASVDPGMSLIVEAIADSGSQFEGFSGGCAATAPCTLSPQSDAAIGASFVRSTGSSPPPPPARTIAVKVTGSGTVTSTPAGISCPGACASPFPTDVAVSLDAAPGAGMNFVEWNGDPYSSHRYVVPPGNDALDLSARFFRSIPPSINPHRVASARTCQVTVPTTPSADWQEWSDIASLDSDRIAHDVDGHGGIHLAEWNDGIVVRRDYDQRWLASDPLDEDVRFWAFATDPQGQEYIARSSWETYPGPAEVDVSFWDRARWNLLGIAMSAGRLDFYDSIYAGVPTLAMDSRGRPLLAFYASDVPLPNGNTFSGLWGFRWNGGWDNLGGASIPSGRRVLVLPAAAGFVGVSEWTVRRNSNRGCGESGAHAFAYDGASWTDLGELKLDQRLNEWSDCPYTNLYGEALTLDQEGQPLIAFGEFPADGGNGDLHLVRWSGSAFERVSDFSDALPRDPSLVRLASGDLWLTWMKAESDGTGFVLSRLRNGQWETVDELRSTSQQFTGSLVCVDAEGNPVVAVTDAGGGHVLYRH